MAASKHQATKKRPAAQSSPSSSRTTVRKRPAICKRPAAAVGVGEGVEPDDAARVLKRFSADFDQAAYTRMVADDCRTVAYREAIGRAVGGKIVLDLGTGPEALLAIMCAEAGAARVVAVEVVPAVAARAAAAVAKAGFADRIEVVTGYAAAATLPRVDMVVHEIVGNLATEEGVAAALADLQARPQVVDSAVPGWSLPRRIETLGAPINLNFALPAERADAEPPSAICLPFIPPRATLLGEPRTLEVVDAAARIQLTQENVHRWLIGGPSTFTGFACAPRVDLDGQSAVDAWTQQTHWRHVLVRLPSPALVEAGDEVQLTFQADLRHFPVVHTFEAAVLRKGRSQPELLGTTEVRLH